VSSVAGSPLELTKAGKVARHRSPHSRMPGKAAYCWPSPALAQALVCMSCLQAGKYIAFLKG
jgi:hypothetical protein